MRSQATAPALSASITLGWRALPTIKHGAARLADIVWVLAASAVIVAIFAPLSMYMYRRER